MVKKNLALSCWKLLQNFPLYDGNRLSIKTLNYYVENYSKIFLPSIQKKKPALEFFLDLN